MLPLVLLFLTFKFGDLQDISSLVDVKTLSELPLEKLLQVKNSFSESDSNAIEEKMLDEKPPEALPLQRRKPHDRGGYHYHYEEQHSKKSGKKSLQSIFQVSVTTLAFLAFGGYLLCLLVHAIKGKSMMEMTTMSPNSAFFRPRPVRRRPTRRPIKLQRPYRNQRPKRHVWPEADPESMYQALVHISEAYTTYHTVDYKRFNYTTSSYFN